MHRRTRQRLSWQHGTRLGAAPRQWLLKMPFHLAELETLVATYPDAIFIQTHREPREIMPSWLSLTGTVRSLTEPRYRYCLTHYGLTAPQADAAFARYAKFARASKVRLE